MKQIDRLFSWIKQLFNSKKTKKIESETHCNPTTKPISSTAPPPKVCTKTEIHEDLEEYLFSLYDLRYNLLTEQVEGRPKYTENVTPFTLIDKRTMNTMVIEARKNGVNCWDRDIERFLKSKYVKNYHPFYSYMDRLPKWDGTDRITPLAERVDVAPVWINGFRLWLLALTAQWMGVSNRCANTLIPLLISPKQGMSKSTFCRLLMPPELKEYYLDKFDFNAKANVETKLGQFGLINLDEFDRYSTTALATLKNLVQLKEITIRKAYASYFLQLGRIASFIGTSNQTELLKDPTGSRRFLCVEVKHIIDCSPIDHAQLFAQLKQLVVEGERVWMNPTEEKDMQEHNKKFMLIRPEQEVFHQLFTIPTEGEEGTTAHTTTEIHRLLTKHNPTSMRGISVQHLGHTLSAMGIKRIHTKVGNKYIVIRKENP